HPAGGRRRRAGRAALLARGLAVAERTWPAADAVAAGAHVVRVAVDLRRVPGGDLPLPVDASRRAVARRSAALLVPHRLLARRRRRHPGRAAGGPYDRPRVPRLSAGVQRAAAARL